ncbi:MAG: bifunctional diaminohydroxyphosphoribosylaminopyrimidine deaminase/5-amino-6-(5-phosphoribosylamino)uracil reductase RibD [Puniceicoccales bacterium]|nr:bifunctional diaminohydroxyphosphoribosylaminopyrimidine deaminase/5-amino-6-(5-phosphoribosylamino)uracil reductase RibD [Puniceicoccales bacterium]
MFENHMQHAIALAMRGWGTTHPNPMVGALIVEDGVVVAEGWHARSGELHAERNALNALGRRPRDGAVMVVTLEPCSTHGRTGACTDAIINSGIKTVVVGATDPFPSHAGRGFEVMRKAGITVIDGILADACEDLNLIFNHWAVRKSPLLALKTATTLDGRIATRTGESKWITGEDARQDVMRWRRYFPAIASSSGTVLADNPRLTSRSIGFDEWCPVRFVFDRRFRLANHPELNVFSDAFASKTIVVTSSNVGHSAQQDVLAHRGVQVWKFDSGDDAAFFAEFKARCAKIEITGILAEGGSGFMGALLKSRQADYLFQYMAPKILADNESKSVFSGQTVFKLTNAISINELNYSKLGQDLLLRGKLVYP